jgi:hypothetical protein
MIEEELAETEEGPQVPRRPALPAGKRISERSVPAALPPALPILGQPLPDRVPVDDATLAKSMAAALGSPLPVRTKPAPFEPARVPEPFVNRAASSATTVAEETTPVVDSPMVPAAPGGGKK